MAKNYNKAKRFIKRFLKVITIVFACFWLVMIIFAFTSIPFHIFYWLGTKNIDKVQTPDAIVLQIKDKFPSITKDSVILITIPSHIRRAVKTFEKAGFENTGSFPTFERVIESDLKFDDKKLGGRKLIPDVGNQINLRYRFWGYLQLEIVILREFFTMGYYKLNGWI